MTPTQLRGGPRDGRTAIDERDLVVQIPSGSRHYVATHWYAEDGRYLGADPPHRRGLWVRVCEWWSA